MEHIKILY